MNFSTLNSTKFGKNQFFRYKKFWHSLLYTLLLAFDQFLLDASYCFM